MNETLYEKILNFLQHETNYDSRAMHPETLITDDLGVDGDDAAQLISNFADQFAVDISSYDWRDYFGQEGLDIVSLFRRQKPLTIADLYYAASNKVWPSQTGRQSLV